MLKAINLTCTRGDRRLFHNLHCAAAAGSALHIRGDNGAGKTSLLQILCGLRRPQAGEVHWHGRPIHQQRAEFVNHLAYLGHDDALHGDLTAYENLTAANMLAANSRDRSIADALRRFNLPSAARASRFLSAGQKQRIALARVWRQPRGVWILDEPATNLDAYGIRILETMLNEHLDAGGAAIFTSHREIKLSAPARELYLHTFQ